MLRSIASIVAGFSLWTVLWLAINQLVLRVAADHFTPEGTTGHAGVLFGILASSVIISVLSGFVTAKIARRGAVKHTAILGVILLAVGVLVQLQYWDAMPLWYHLGFLALLLPMSILGGRLAHSS